MTPTDQLDPTRVDIEPFLAAQYAGKSGTDPESIGAAMGRAFGALGAYGAKHGIAFAGPPRTIYLEYDDEETSFIVTFPLPAVGAEPVAEDGIEVGEIAGGPALRFSHHGPYEGLPATYGTITEWLRDEGLIQSESDWGRFMPLHEEYVTDPDTTPPERMLTYIYLPLEEDADDG